MEIIKKIMFHHYTFIKYNIIWEKSYRNPNSLKNVSKNLDQTPPKSLVPWDPIENAKSCHLTCRTKIFKKTVLNCSDMFMLYGRKN